MSASFTRGKHDMSIFSNHLKVESTTFQTRLCIFPGFWGTLPGLRTGRPAALLLSRYLWDAGPIFMVLYCFSENLSNIILTIVFFSKIVMDDAKDTPLELP